MSDPQTPDPGDLGHSPTLVRATQPRLPTAGPASFQPPPRLGPYSIERLLGRGGMAAVFLATEAPSGRKVALKLMDPALGADPSFVERFVHEAKSCASLHHPNVVEVFGFGEQDGWRYLACELVDGGTVASLLSAMHELPSALAAELISQLLAGLAHAHAAGVVHRDLKPENLLLTSAGVLKIADFGIARTTDGGKLTRTGMLVGTVGYMSPEQAKGLRVDHRSDLFATGVILYELLTGTNPFHSDNPATSITRILTQQALPIFQAKPTAPRELEAVLDRLLAFEASDRFEKAQDGVDALAPFISARRRTQPSLVADCLREPAQWKKRLDCEASAALVDDARSLTVGSPAEQNRAAIKLHFALELDPANPEARSLLEELGARMKLSFGPSSNPKIAELEALLSEQPAQTQAMTQLAQLYRLEGNPLKAAIWLKRHLRVKPHDLYAANQLSQLTGDRVQSSATAELMAGVKTGGFKAAGVPAAAVPRVPTQVAPVPLAFELPHIEPVSPLARLAKRGALVAVALGLGFLAIRTAGRTIDSWSKDVDNKTQALRQRMDAPATGAPGSAVRPPDFDRQADALFGAAAAAEQKGDRESAIALFTRFIGEFPKRPQVREATFRRAKLLLLLERNSEARSEFDDFLERFPGSPDAAEALLRRGQASAANLGDDAALADFDAFVSQHASSVLVLEALVSRGELKVRRKDFPGAQADFKQVLGRLAPADPLYQRAQAGLKTTL